MVRSRHSAAYARGVDRPSESGALGASVILAAIFLPLGILKLLDATDMDRVFAAWGFLPWFVYLVGAWEIMAAVLLLLPRLASYGGGMILVQMFGAAVTLVANGEWYYLFAPFFIGVIAAYVTWGRIGQAPRLGTAGGSTAHH